MVRIGALGTNMSSRTGAVATAISGCTAAEAAGLAELLTILASRPDLLQPALQVSTVAKFQINLG